MGMIRRLYNRVMDLAARPHAERWLAAVSFIESSVFPIPPDVMLAPMVLVQRDKAWRYAAICTLASVAGGVFGYGIGQFLFDAVGQPVIAFYGYETQFAHFQELYNKWGVFIVFAAGITPLPYKVFTIASGLTGLNVIVFAVASLLSRGIRYFLVAALLWKFGIPIRDFVERWLGWLVTAFFLLLVGGFVLVKFMM